MLDLSNLKNERWKEKARKVKEWAVQHKTEIIIGATVFATAVIAIVILNNKEGIVEAFDKSRTSLKPATPKSSPAIRHIPSDSTVSQTAQIASVPPVIDDPVIARRTPCEHERDGGVRNLHDGWKASPAKISEAAEKGIVLGDGQTLVNSCTVGGKSA